MEIIIIPAIIVSIFIGFNNYRLFVPYAIVWIGFLIYWANQRALGELWGLAVGAIIAPLILGNVTRWAIQGFKKGKK